MVGRHLSLHDREEDSRNLAKAQEAQKIYHELKEGAGRKKRVYKKKVHGGNFFNDVLDTVGKVASTVAPLAPLLLALGKHHKKLMAMKHKKGGSVMMEDDGGDALGGNVIMEDDGGYALGGARKKRVYKEKNHTADYEQKLKNLEKARATRRANLARKGGVVTAQCYSANPRYEEEERMIKGPNVAKTWSVR